MDFLSQIKIELYCIDPFLGTILASSPILIENEDCDTLYTDGYSIFYNEQFVNSLTFPEQVAVFAHEASHIALLHCIRFKKIEPVYHEIFNIAADYVVNDILAGYDRPNSNLKLPKSALKMPSEFKGYSTDVIFDVLKQRLDNGVVFTINIELADLRKFSDGFPGGKGRNKDESQGDSDRNRGGSQGDSDRNRDESQGDSGRNRGGSQDDSGRNKDDSQSEKGRLIDILGRIQNALSVGSTHGFGGRSAEVERMISELLRPKLNWRYLLRKYCNESKCTDYSWSVPSRRSSDFYLPSLCRESDAFMRNVNVYIDVSGSIKNDVLNIFLSELTYIFQDLELETMTVTSFSNDLSNKVVFDNPRGIIKYKAVSTGGTEISCVIDDINKSKSSFSIIFTDGIFDKSPIKHCKGKLFWVIYKNTDFTTPKGSVVYVE